MYVAALGVSASPALAGGKAATLARVISAGLRVPAGVVITTRAHELMRAIAGVSDSFSEAAAYQAYRGAQWPPEIAVPVLAASRWLGTQGQGLLAVRSSAVGEDGRETSLAGRFHSDLRVRPPDGVAEAVARCWASAQRTGPPAAMAVIVQVMASPAWAGVAFTADAARRDPSQVLIEAVPGLADELCAGLVTPHRFTFDKATLRPRARAVTPALPQPPISCMALVAECAIRLEHALGGPQDTEWCLESGEPAEVSVLQSRPITTPVAVASAPVSLTTLLTQL